ncbi:MAG: hypothetical protein VX949_02985 [Planctomycetota bacterium]|nr:hypothetical protein [Planctomycetota bacterium]
MIVAARWQGDADGVLCIDCGDGVVEIDRPGDLVSRMMEEECDPTLQAAILVHGYCLATQGVRLPHLVRQVLGKIGNFIRSVSMDSMPLYQAVEHFNLFVRDCPVEGAELREAVLAEAKRYHQQLIFIPDVSQ